MTLIKCLPYPPRAVEALQLKRDQILPRSLQRRTARSREPSRAPEPAPWAPCQGPQAPGIGPP